MTKEERKTGLALIKIAKLIKKSGLGEQDTFAVLFSALLTTKQKTKS